ncbi:hypothetical protein Srot_1293 [Segniliparus rotundus DSM 44985]|uniref:Uncharacterized protein n=1 Tax=Segniliparus rotundus (strain ATCC BAA-972 / CDC 1076 / CIP 108378 / DSM 44985 / JCM 13578) TaxID=640132 RepID=D6ZFN8_SEGRD|nr:hypothetical protein [Segniliparus rotundus]ADG97762.1 hypothetical protein Srot_1293 [Segniliparus rotundus DSM 44985]
MSMFGSYRQPPFQPPDGLFPRLGTEDVSYIEGLVADSFAQHSLHASLHGEEISVTGGQTYPTREVMDACADAGDPDLWPDAVDRWVSNIVAVRNMPTTIEFDRDDMLSKVHTRIITDAFADDLDEEHSYRKPLVGQLIGVLGVELPQVTAVLTDEEIAGHDLESLWAQGQRKSNFLKVQPQRVPNSMYDLKFVIGDTVFVSGKVLDFPALLDSLIGEARHGVLFSVPAANILIWHVLRESAAALRGMDELGQSTWLTFKDTPAPLSTEVYFWHDGQYSRVTYLDEHGARQRDPHTPFWGVLDDLDGRAGTLQ